MSTTLSETSTYSSTVTVIEDGDTITETLLRAGLQPLADRTKYLHALAHHIVQTINPINTPDGWEVGRSATYGTALVQNSLQIGSSYDAFIPLRLPAYGSLDTVIVYMTVPTGRSSVPATAPTATLWIQSNRSSAGTSDSSNDAAANINSLAVYETDQVLAINGISQTLSDSITCYLQIAGENGGGASLGTYLATAVSVVGITTIVSAA